MKFLSILAILLTSVLVQAQDNYDLTGRWGVGLGLGTTFVTGPKAFTEGVAEVDGGFAGGLWARYHLTPRFGFEVGYTRLVYDFASNAAPFNDLDPSEDLITANVAYRTWPTERYHILVQLGLGYARSNDFQVGPDDKRDDFAMTGRLGGEYMATKDLMMAIHANYYHVNGSGAVSDINVWAPMLALTYYFGGTSAPVAGDADGDGVNDDMDKCANTPANTNVGADGCPLKASKTDADGDGVSDEMDKCPGSPAGEKVTEYGCAKTDKLEITLNVQFASGSSQLTPQFDADLKKFAEFMQKYTDAKAEIEGHTDNTGAEKFNYTISQKRADAVRKYLINKFKIDKSRLTSKGYGPSQPIDDNSKPEGRAKNRRVVAHVKTEAPAQK